MKMMVLLIIGMIAISWPYLLATGGIAALVYFLVRYKKNVRLDRQIRLKNRMAIFREREREENLLPFLRTVAAVGKNDEEFILLSDAYESYRSSRKEEAIKLNQKAQEYGLDQRVGIPR